ncbi:MAG: hypothetical protein P8P40_10010, partial [Sulfitobacter sp.]|nr:hypothetical protein [Sulfitobacter sp.]
SRRSIVARRTLTLGTTIATAALGSAAFATPITARPDDLHNSPVHLVQQSTQDNGVAAGGEGEGAVPEDPEVVLLRDLGRIEGYLMTALQLYEQGDIAAAQNHFAQAVSEEFDTATGLLAEKGQATALDQLISLADAATAQQPLEALRLATAELQTALEAIRSDSSAFQQTTALVALMRFAAERYSIATAKNTVTNLYEYQASWGFLNVIKTQATTMTQSDNSSVAKAGTKVLGYLAATAPAFGDMMGQGITDMRASLIYGAAARIELASIGLQ